MKIKCFQESCHYHHLTDGHVWYDLVKALVPDADLFYRDNGFLTSAGTTTYQS